MLISETAPQQWELECRNDAIKYETQMYGMYPVIAALADDFEHRVDLLSTCYDTMRLLEQGYPWMALLPPTSSVDELSDALNGTKEN